MGRITYVYVYIEIVSYFFLEEHIAVRVCDVVVRTAMLSIVRNHSTNETSGIPRNILGF